MNRLDAYAEPTMAVPKDELLDDGASKRDALYRRLGDVAQHPHSLWTPEEIGAVQSAIRNTTPGTPEHASAIASGKKITGIMHSLTSRPRGRFGRNPADMAVNHLPQPDPSTLQDTLLTKLPSTDSGNSNSYVPRHESYLATSDIAGSPVRRRHGRDFADEKQAHDDARSRMAGSATYYYEPGATVQAPKYHAGDTTMAIDSQPPTTLMPTVGRHRADT